MAQAKPSRKNSLLQIIICFVIPIIILTWFSSESRLGAAKGLILALSLPIVYEGYSVYKKKKLNYTSLLAVGGILVTGAISLLGLSEEWLAYRRAIPYLAVSLAIFISVLLKHPVLNAALPLVFDMDEIYKMTKKNKQSKRLAKNLSYTSYAFSVFFILLAIASFVLTKVMIHSPTNSPQFNQEYASLRIISLAAITLPLIIGTTLILFQLVNSLEKLTGLDFEKLVKKK